ncbi:unnamed protein product [Brassicogethes aeneus]|uniref:Transposase domain-containing protein n=1 Tax=Brassicogethes aeneus TaxID=1431903 RepID=A0A9P0BAJ8_BRAAE|nr:unnamed protein product [Brassicogethes aeneus]
MMKRRNTTFYRKLKIERQKVFATLNDKITQNYNILSLTSGTEVKDNRICSKVLSAFSSEVESSKKVTDKKSVQINDEEQREVIDILELNDIENVELNNKEELSNEFGDKIVQSNEVEQSEGIIDIGELNDTIEKNNDQNCFEADPKASLNVQLQHWAVTNKVTHIALNNLLKILNPHFKNLPLDPRTLLKTPRKTITRFVEPGQYFHFGLKENITFLLENAHRDLSQCEICVNIDGLPISKSSGSQLYPILISLFPVNENLVSCVGLYHGYDKPKNANNFLKEFVKKAIDLTNNGVLFNNKVIPFRIKAFICDVPAKAFIRCTKGHTGFSSCTKCKQRGEYIVNTVCFPRMSDEERTNEDFLLQVDKLHHTGQTILADIPNIGLVSCFPVEYMHLTLKNMLRKSNQPIQQVVRRLGEIKKYQSE